MRETSDLELGTSGDNVDLGVEDGRHASPLGTADATAARAEAGIIERALWRSMPEALESSSSCAASSARAASSR
eukprot:3528669-Karenia_brevis.AAC.1